MANQEEGLMYQYPSGNAKKNSSGAWVIFLVVVLLIVLGTLIYILIMKSNISPSDKRVEEVVQMEEIVEEIILNQFIFVPVNWDSTKGDFEKIVGEAFSYYGDRYTEVYNRKFLENFDEEWFVEGNEAIVLTSCIGKCEFDDLEYYTLDVDICIEDCIGSEEIVDPAPTIIGLSNSEIHRGQTFQEFNTLFIDVREESKASAIAHEISHLFWNLCDEYSYEEWKWQDESNREMGEDGCPNSYPLCCRDNPMWENNNEGYQKYLEDEDVGENCYSYHGDETDFCAGSVCEPSIGFEQCRSMAGPYIYPEDMNYYFGGELEYKVPVGVLR